MATGKVKFYNDTKGFGFITPDAGGPDIFAHHTDIKTSGFQSLKLAQRVEYDLKEGPKGPAAANIKLLA